MTNHKVKLLLLICLLTGLGAVVSTFAAGSHLQLGYNDGAFNFDFRVGSGESKAASVLALIALATGLGALGLHLSHGRRAEDEPAAGPDAGGPSRSPDVPGFLRRLTKSRTDEWLGGVCGGLGEHTPLPSWVWRVIFLLLLCWYGTGVLLYLVLWICLPEPPREIEKPGTRPAAAVSAAEQ